jgi:hypothetical protein
MRIKSGKNIINQNKENIKCTNIKKLFYGQTSSQIKLQFVFAPSYIIYFR